MGIPQSVTMDKGILREHELEKWVYEKKKQRVEEKQRRKNE